MVSNDGTPSFGAGLAQFLRRNKIPADQRTPEHIRRMLWRQNHPWLSFARTASSSEISLKHYEPIPNEPAFQEYLPNVLHSPFFYRLAFVKQLSTVVITSHLDASHSRLSHALGATKVAARMLERIKSCGFPERAKQLSSFEITACLFFTFIHDAFHGPMGHSLDLMKDVFGIGLDEKLDDALLSEALAAVRTGKPNPAGRMVLAAADLCVPGEGEELLALVELLSDPYALEEEKPELFFLRDIVDSKLDADRIDYLLRDGLFLETPAPAALPKVVESARAVAYKDRNRLAYSIEYEQVIAKTLGLRRELYTVFYEAPEKLIVDDMLCHLLFYILAEHDLIARSLDIEQEALRSEIVEQIMLLTDDALMALLTDLSASPPTYSLLYRIRQRRYYQCVECIGVELGSVDTIRGQYQAWMEEISKIRDKMKERRGFPLRQRGIDKDVEALRRVSDEYLENTALLTYAYQVALHGSFVNQHKVERSIWRRLMQKEDANEKVQDFAVEEYGITVDEIGSLDLGRHPPLHLTQSSFFKLFSKEDLTEHAKEATRPSQPSTGVLFYETQTDADGHLEHAVVRKHVKPAVEETHTAYPLVLSVPDTLLTRLADDDIRFAEQDIREALYQELRQCDWLLSALEEGRL